MCNRHYTAVKRDYEGFRAAADSELERRRCIRRTRDLIHFGDRSHQPPPKKP